MELGKDFRKRNMTIYEVFVYISKGNIEEVIERMPEQWVLGRDFFVEKVELIPESTLKTKDVSIKIWKRDCEYDYLPWPFGMTGRTGNNKTDTFSFLRSVDPDELPPELYQVCQRRLYLIDNLINAPLYVCSKCGKNNKRCAGPCGKCGSKPITAYY